jgi:hypothetical protein
MLKMVGIAQKYCAAAKFPGSGGAVLGMCRDPSKLNAMREECVFSLSRCHIASCLNSKQDLVDHRHLVSYHLSTVVRLSAIFCDVLCRYISEMGAVFVLLEPCQPRARGGFSSPVSHKQSHIGTAGSSLSRSSMAALQSKEMRAQMLVAASPFSHSSELLWNGMQNGVPNGTPSGPPTSLSPASTTAGASVRVQPQGVSAMGLPEL